MPAITHASASAAILRHVNESRLTQHAWHSRADDGREIACLLGAIHPSVTSPAECNGDLMPMWLAQLIPVLFDGLPSDRIYAQARRFGELVARWHVLAPAQWDGIEVRFKIKAIDEAIDAARPVCEGKPYWPQVVTAAQQVTKALNGDGDLAAARGAAEAAVLAAAWAADAAAWAAARAAETAAWAAAWAAETAAWAAARAAARAAETAADAAAWAAGGIAYDRLFTFLLDQIEAEIG